MQPTRSGGMRERSERAAASRSELRYAGVLVLAATVSSFAAATSRGPVVAASAPEPDAASGGLAGSALRAGLKLEEEHASEL